MVVSEGQFVVRTTADDSLLERGVGRAWLIILTLGAVFIGLAVLFANRLGRHVSTPVTDLAAVAHRLRDGDLEARAPRAGPPETVELADALNQLAERIEDLLVAERAHVGDLSHRLRTPVTALRLDADAVTDPELAADAGDQAAAAPAAPNIIVEARMPAMVSRRSL